MAMHDNLDATAYYDRDAAGFAARYDSVTFSAVHPLLSHHLPNAGRALDIGAGSGRDSRALATHGLAVTAIEPSAGLRAIGEAHGGSICWVDDRLPDLASLTGEPHRYDLILCSAVLMLVAPDDLLPSFATMARLLTPAGRVAINIRAPMPQEPPEIFFLHSDVDMMVAAEEVGLICRDRGETIDALGRTAYRWRSFIFGHRA
jgi:SAM-dependent methyltransferase